MSKFIIPVIGMHDIPVVYNMVLPIIFIILGIAIGIVLYIVSILSMKKRTSPAFIGGEKDSADMKISGTEFYNQIKQIPFQRLIHCIGEKIHRFIRGVKGCGILFY